MITSMKGCVAYNDLYPWPISSRSFGLGLKNCVRSVASTVLDGFFPYLVQMITSMRCVAYDDLWPWPIFSRSFNLDFENRVRSVTFSVLDRLFPYLPQIITNIRGCVACSVYNKIIKFLFFAKFYLFFLHGIPYDSIEWVIMRRRGVSSECWRSCCSNFVWYMECCPAFSCSSFSIFSLESITKCAHGNMTYTSQGDFVNLNLNSQQI